MGIWPFRADDSFGEFLVAHGGTLEELELVSKKRGGAMIFGSSQKLKRDSLPHLKSFKGHSWALYQMIMARMECLKSLRRLEFGAGSSFDPSVIYQDIFEQVDQWRAEDGTNLVLGNLEELQIDLNYSDLSVDKILGTIHSCARLWGRTLKVWLGDVVMMQLDELAPAFVGFEKLRVIHHDIWATQTLHSTNRRRTTAAERENFILALATQCPMLEELVTGPRSSSQITRDGATPRIVHHIML